MKTIHNYRDTMFVRILANTTSPDIDKKNDMIGGVFEVNTQDFETSKFLVWNKDKSNYWHFNKEDCQIVFPDFEIDGHILGVGDEIKDEDEIHTIIDLGWCDDGCDGGLCINTYYRHMDGYITYTFCIDSLKEYNLHKTIYPIKKEETIEIAGRKYNKSDFEKAVKDLKEVK